MKRGYKLHTVEHSVDVHDIVNIRCLIGPMAEQITTRLGTVTLQVVTSSSSESQTVAWMHFLQHGQTTILQNVAFDPVDLFLQLLLPEIYSLKLSEDCTECTYRL